jgi:hypothetical protein
MQIIVVLVKVEEGGAVVISDVVELYFDAPNDSMK